MKNIVISVEHLTKQYDLGVIGTGTLTRDLNRWWAKLRGQPDPYTPIGHQDHFERIGESILALDDISFKVEQGQALGIIGKNGAGKSTLLKILSRVTAPTSGVVKMKGRIGSLLEVGTGFHHELTGKENVYLSGAILGMSKDEVDRKFDEIVDFSGVEQFIDTPVKRYSSGMFVRLAFAVAAHLDPDILIVDEVLAVGDAEFQKKCLGKMGDVAGEGRTVMFVSHNMTAIQNLCKHAIWLQHGKIHASGLSGEVVDSYLSEQYDELEPFINLLDKAMRSPHIDQIFETASLYNNNKLTSEFYTGDSLTLKTMLILNPENIDVANVGFDIKDKSDKIVFASNTQQYYSSLPIKKKNKYQLCFTIPQLLLNPGYYSISLYVGNGIRDFEIIHDAIPFHVKWRDRQDIRAPMQSWGPLSIPITWDWKASE